MNTSKVTGCLLVTITALYMSICAKGQIVPGGAIEMEELDESCSEQLATLQRNPIRINTASRSRLEECGLFSAFQLASLMDYRSRNGDILSLTELSFINGFDPASVKSMSPYIDFSSNTDPGRSSTSRRHCTEVQVMSVIKRSDDEWSTRIGGKVSFEIDNLLSLNAGIRNESWSASGIWYGNKHVEKIVLGDFNARFGQGLTMWSGFSLSGFSSTDSFSKKASGITATRSYTGDYSLRGAAVQTRWGNCGLAVYGALNGILGSYLSWRRKSFDTGISFCWAEGQYSRVGSDLRFSHDGWDFWGEGIFDFRAHRGAGLAGARWNIGYRKSAVFLGRYYPPSLPDAFSGAARSGSKASGEAGLSAAIAFGGLSTTLDAAAIADKYLQIKNVSLWEKAFGTSQSIKIRAATRIRLAEQLAFKADLRFDYKYSSERWKLNLRADAVKCIGFAGLAYAEGGFSEKRLSIWLRTTGFLVDNWDDRIYVYERDAPGSYSTSAYYGRGIGGDSYVSWKISSRSNLYFRVFGTYLFNKNAYKAGAKVQYYLRL